MPVRRLLSTAAATTGLLLVPLAGGAAAHVTVSSPGATQGGFAKLVFRTPTERDVPTTRLEVAMPTETPIASVSVKPKTGWTYQLVKAAPPEPFEAFGEPVTEVVTRIVWTATAGGIRPEEFDEFEVSAGPLPETDELELPALQTYSDGEVVRWIEQTPESGEEPERPAPVLALAPPEDDEGTAAVPASDVDTEPVAASQDTGGADGLSVAALVVAALALVTGAAALLRGRRAA